MKRVGRFLYRFVLAPIVLVMLVGICMVIILAEAKGDQIRRYLEAD